MNSQRLKRAIEVLAVQGTAELESFFLGQGLSDVFSALRLEKWGRRKRVNEALIAAERRGVLDDVLRAAFQEFGGATETGEPAKPLSRLRLDLNELAAEMDSWEGWVYSDQAVGWAGRLNSLLAHLRIHIGSEEVPGDFQFREREYSSTGKTLTKNGYSRLRRAVSAAIDLLGGAIPSAPSGRRDARIESLHPEVRRVAEQLYLDGHNSQAIFEAFKAVNNRVKRISGEDADGKALMARVFSEERPILKLNAGSTRSDRDEQEGFKFVFMGAMLGIRNPKAHDEIADTDDDRSLEYLALASLLMRRLDDAESLG
jgi:uncharacterized protein (TIGR02391 family)